MTTATDPLKTGIPAFKFLGDYTQATLPGASSWSGYMVRISDVGDHGGYFFSTGTRWKAVGGKVVLSSQGDAVTGLTNSITATNRVIRAWLPATTWQNFDRVMLELDFAKSGTTDNATLSIYVGPTGDNTDTVVVGAAFVIAGATGRSGGILVPLKRFSATSVRKVGNNAVSSSAIGSTGGTAVASAVSVSSLDSAGAWVSAYVASSSTNDTVDVYHSELTLNTP